MRERIEAEFRRKVNSSNDKMTTDAAATPILDSRFRNIVISKCTGLRQEIFLNDKFPYETYDAMHMAVIYFFGMYSEPSTELPETDSESTTITADETSVETSESQS